MTTSDSNDERTDGQVGDHGDERTGDLGDGQVEHRGQVEHFEPQVEPASADPVADVPTASSPLPPEQSGAAGPRGPSRRDPSSKPLTPRELRFIELFLGGATAREAYRQAGYGARSSDDAVDANAARLLARPRVAAAIEAARASAFDRAEVTADRVIGGLAAIAFGDVRRLFDAAGRLLPIGDIDERTAAAVVAIEVVENPGNEKRGREPSTTSKVKLGDRVRALELLGRHLQLFKDRVEVLGTAPTSTTINVSTTVNPPPDVFSRIDELMAGFRRAEKREAIASPAAGLVGQGDGSGDS